MSTNATRVVLADDEVLMREGLAGLLERSVGCTSPCTPRAVRIVHLQGRLRSARPTQKPAKSTRCPSRVPALISRPSGMDQLVVRLSICILGCCAGRVRHEALRWTTASPLQPQDAEEQLIESGAQGWQVTIGDGLVALLRNAEGIRNPRSRRFESFTAQLLKSDHPCGSCVSDRRLLKQLRLSPHRATRSNTTHRDRPT